MACHRYMETSPYGCLRCGERRAAHLADATPTTHTIYFTKLFTGGLLKGLTYQDTATGPDVATLAKQYRIGREVKRPVGGGSPYRIIDASFQSYAR